MNIGEKRTVGNLERPFIYFEGGKMKCMFFAASDSNGHGFEKMTKAFNQCTIIKCLKHLWKVCMILDFFIVRTAL